MSNESREAVQIVVDRINSWQETAPEGTIETELRKGLGEAGVEVADDDVTRLVEAIESSDGPVSVDDVLV